MENNFLKFAAICLLIGIVTPIYGQYNETIRTGRPGQSIGPYTVGSRVFQIQSGVEYVMVETNDQIHSFINNNVIRYGLTRKLEVSTLFDLRSDYYNNTDSPDFSLGGLSNLQLGFRYNFIDHPDGIIPALGFQVRSRVPLHSSDYEIDRFAPVMVLVTGHSLGKGWGLNTNWITAYNGNSTQPDYNYVLNLFFPLANKLSGFIENYGQLNGDFDTYFDGGLAYLVNPNLQLDIYGGISENDGVYSNFISAGLSWRTVFN